MSERRESLHSMLLRLGDQLATAANRDDTTINCITGAIAAQYHLDPELDTIPKLRDNFEVDCGVVFEITTGSDSDEQERGKTYFHASNFLGARALDGPHAAVVYIDPYFGTRGRVTEKNHPVSLFRQYFDPETVIYGQRLLKGRRWETGIATGLRRPPFRLREWYRTRLVVMGGSVGKTALEEIRFGFDHVQDRNNVPVMLLKR